jgi:hypothetical protein
MNSEFPTPPEEVARLARELELLRADFTAGLSKLSQMERRLRAAYPTLPRRAKPRGSSQLDSTPDISREELLTRFENLISLRKSGQDMGYEKALLDMLPGDAVRMAIELGIGKGKKTTPRQAIEGIRRRVGEAVLLEKNRQVEESPR